MGTRRSHEWHGDEAIDYLLSLGDGELDVSSWEPGELSRRGLEAIVRQAEGDSRRRHSSGSLRMFGRGVEGNSVSLDAVSRITGLWQRALSNIGATLEHISQKAGRLPQSVLDRTELCLVAAPGAGSVVLKVEARQEPLNEMHGKGNNSLFASRRPLIDRSSEVLLDLLELSSQIENETAREELRGTLVELGPRVAGSVLLLSKSLNHSNIDLDANWEEPDMSSRRSSISSEQSAGLARFIEGSKLDAVTETIRGISVTVSTSERWLIQDGGIQYRVKPGRLGTEARESVTPNMFIELLVSKRSVVRADGTFKDQYEAIELLTPRQE